jgi:hypothetical protein
VNQLFDESGSDEELEASPAAGSSDEAEPASSGEDVGDDADPVPPPRCAGAPVTLLPRRSCLTCAHCMHIVNAPLSDGAATVPSP